TSNPPVANRGPGIASTMLQALRSWTPRQVLAAIVAAIAVAVIIGIATVLIPNPIFARDIPPVWWNYPVWLLTSILSGILIATYVRPGSPGQPASEPGDDSPEAQRSERRTSRLGMAGGLLAW